MKNCPYEPIGNGVLWGFSMETDCEANILFPAVMTYIYIHIYVYYVVLWLIGCLQSQSLDWIIAGRMDLAVMNMIKRSPSR